jgi:Uma2 family endonuclease
MALLARHGVREFWLVDPDAVRVEIYRLEGDGFALASDARDSDVAQSHLFPGLSVSPSELVP